MAAACKMPRTVYTEDLKGRILDTFYSYPRARCSEAQETVKTKHIFQGRSLLIEIHQLRRAYPKIPPIANSLFEECTNC